MGRSTAATRRGPVSVVLPDELLLRVQAVARQRGLKLSPAVRALVAERIGELDDQERLTAAEKWQRQQAWATGEGMNQGSPAEAGHDELRAAFAAARKRRR